MKNIEKQTPLYNQVYDILWEKILSGELRPCQRMRHVDLAQTLNVSRTPVREALRKLEQEGVLRALGGGGYEVRSVEPNDLKKLYRCRMALEMLAVEDATSRLSKTDLERLQGIIHTTRMAIDDRDFDAALKHNTEFHRIIFGCCGNSYLINMIESLQRQILFNRKWLMLLAKEQEWREDLYAQHILRTQTDHQWILDALVARDGLEAAQRMRYHLNRTSLSMESVLEKIQYTEPAELETDSPVTLSRAGE